jgi:hypothetical protein
MHTEDNPWIFYSFGSNKSKDWNHCIVENIFEKYDVIANK